MHDDGAQGACYSPGCAEDALPLDEEIHGNGIFWEWEFHGNGNGSSWEWACP